MYLPLVVQDRSIQLAVPLLGLAVWREVNHCFLPRGMAGHDHISLLMGVEIGCGLDHTHTYTHTHTLLSTHTFHIIVLKLIT